MHKAINQFKSSVGKVSKNYTTNCWVLKCDVKKFFASIDHEILLSILNEYIPDKDNVGLLKNIVESFETLDSRFRLPAGRHGGNDKIGLPLGNLTSQLFANVYMNVFDQWVKHKLKVKHYIRYADDFVFLSRDKLWLKNIVPQIRQFLSEKLKLTLHPDKMFLKTTASGVDFLGWVHFPKHRIPRAVTKRRMFFRIKETPRPETLQSYLGLLKHGNTAKARQELLGRYWVWQS